MTHQQKANTMAQSIGFNSFSHCQSKQPATALAIAKMALALEWEEKQKSLKICAANIQRARQELARLERALSLNSVYEREINLSHAV